MTGTRDMLIRILGDASGGKKALKEVEGEAGKLEASPNLSGLKKKLGGLFEEFTATVPGLKSGMQIVGKSGEDMAHSVQSAGGGIGLGMATAGAAVAAFAIESGAKFAEAGVKVLDYKRVTGETAEQASKDVAVFQQYGVSSETAAGSMAKFARNIDSGKVAAFGVEVVHGKDGLIDMSATLGSAADKFRATEDPTKRAALGMALFGKSWADMVPILEKGSSTLTDAYKHVSQGNVFSEGDLKSAEDFKVSMKQMTEELQGMQNELGKAVLPMMTELVKDLTKAADEADRLAKPVGGLKSIFGGLWESIKTGNPLLAGYHQGIKAAKEETTLSTEATVASAVALAGMSEGNVKGTQTLGELKEQIKGVKEMTKEETEALKEQTARDIEAGKAADAAAKAMQGQFAATQSLYAATLSLDGLLDHFGGNLDTLRTAHNGVVTAQKAHGKNSPEYQAALLAERDAVRGVEMAVVAVGTAAVGAAQDKKTAAGGGELTILEKYQAQKIALDNLAKQYPEAKLAVDDYENKALDPLIAKQTEVARTAVAMANDTVAAWRNADGQITITADHADRVANAQIGTSGGTADAAARRAAAAPTAAPVYVDPSTSGGPAATHAARGGLFKARAGGLNVNLAEAGVDEAVVPLAGGAIPVQLSGGGGGPVIHVTVNVAGSVWTERDLTEAIRNNLIRIYRQTGGNLFSVA